jgi:hypothetical protein
VVAVARADMMVMKERMMLGVAEASEKDA